MLGALKIASRGGQNHASTATRSRAYHEHSASILVTALSVASCRRRVRVACRCARPRASPARAHLVDGLATTVSSFRWSAAAPQALIRSGRCAAADAERRGARHGRARGRLPGNVLIVANHISWLDIFVLTLQPARFVAKAELGAGRRGRLIASVGTLFIERERRRDTHRSTATRGGAARGDVVAIFPEGTTTDGTVLLASTARCCSRSSTPGHVQPVAIRYRTPGGRAQLRRPTSATELHARRSGSVTGERALVVELHSLPPLPARAAPARAVARGRGSYPNGFGVTGAAARHLEHAAIVEPHRGQRAAPQAARIEHQHVGGEHQLERRPVPAHDRHAGAMRAAGCSNHGAEACRRVRRARAFRSNSIVPSAVQKRSRVQALTTTRRRS